MEVSPAKNDSYAHKIFPV